MRDYDDPAAPRLTPRGEDACSDWTAGRSTNNPQIEYIAWAFDAERAAGSPGGLLYTETLGSTFVIHLVAG
jgi:hypothetical protein